MAMQAPVETLAYVVVLMATAHGAGLMVVPVFVGMMSMAGEGGHTHYMAATGAGAELHSSPPAFTPWAIWL